MSGWRKPVRSGGFVGSVSMNADTRGRLGVDPEGVVVRSDARRPPAAALEGAAVDVQVMEQRPDTRERPKGRFKMPL